MNSGVEGKLSVEVQARESGDLDLNFSCSLINCVSVSLLNFSEVQCSYL